MARRGRGHAQDHAAAGGQLVEPAAHEVAEPAAYPVAYHGAANRSCHDETHVRRAVIGAGQAEMHDNRGGGGADTRPDGVGELGAGTHACRGRQHGGRRVRPRAGRGPCGGGRRGWPDRHECACAAGTHGSSPGAGCSAGTSACSPRNSPHMARATATGWPGRNRAAGWRRPQAATTYGTGAAGPGSNHPAAHHHLGGQGDTPRTGHRLPTGCGEPLAAVAQRLLACAPPALPPPSTRRRTPVVFVGEVLLSVARRASRRRSVT